MDKDNPSIYRDPRDPNDPSDFTDFINSEADSEEEEDKSSVVHDRYSVDTDAEAKEAEDAENEDDEAEDDDDEEVDESKEDEGDGKKEADDGEGEDKDSDYEARIKEHEETIKALRENNKKLSDPQESEDAYKLEELAKLANVNSRDALDKISAIEDSEEKAKALNDLLTAQRNVDKLATESAKARAQHDKEMAQVRSLFPRHDPSHKDYDPIITEQLDKLYDKARGEVYDDSKSVIKEYKTMPLDFYKQANDLLDKQAELATVDTQKGEGAKEQAQTPKSKASPKSRKAKAPVSPAEELQRQQSKDFWDEVRSPSGTYL